MKRSLIIFTAVISIFSTYATSVVQATTFDVNSSDSSATLKQIYDDQNDKLNLKNQATVKKSAKANDKAKTSDFIAPKTGAADQKMGTVEVYYVDEATAIPFTMDNGQDHITMTQAVGSPYATEEKKFTDYKFDKTVGVTSGTYQETTQKIIYLYKKIDPNDTSDTSNKASLTVKYVDVDTNKSVQADVVKDYSIGDQYDTTTADLRPKTINGDDQTQYNLVTDMSKLPSNASGTIVSGGNNVTYYYKAVPKTGKVVIKYVDKDSNNSIAPDTSISGKLGDVFDVGAAPDIKGYTADKSYDGTKTGKYDKSDQTFTFYYTKKPVTGKDVTVRYLDKDTNEELATTVTLSGDTGSAYNAKKIDIDGYKLVNVDGDQSGSFTASPQKVTFYYTKDDNSAVDPNAGNEDDDNNIDPDAPAGNLTGSGTNNDPATTTETNNPGANTTGSTDSNGALLNSTGGGSYTADPQTTKSSGGTSNNGSSTNDPATGGGAGGNNSSLPQTSDQKQNYWLYILLGLMSLSSIPVIKLRRR
ncbi:MucBP domain-containing protein [Bombilactobacillus thymidiniphilus]|uniref:MucBP domain-containing protein n=1 Tax=Bombilactobacillus thymidiniphilus TaxID=2923363 RepID=A0ABY4PE69_9LACO|nr:MucBP domain-containing protein [Bombilactobacillus thymidiniphilus]UQS84078.1 MucBP domain-containing protein [Bombilactobacillus thymidiniphilus]